MAHVLTQDLVVQCSAVLGMVLLVVAVVVMMVVLVVVVIMVVVMLLLLPRTNFVSDLNMF